MSFQDEGERDRPESSARHSTVELGRRLANLNVALVALGALDSIEDPGSVISSCVFALKAHVDCIEEVLRRRAPNGGGANNN
jgi:hypothetical protein